MDRLLVAGSREWSDGDLIFEVLGRYPSTTTTVIDGQAPGADKLAHWNASQRLGMGWSRFPAYWGCGDYESDVGSPCELPDGRHHAIHGSAAGPIRNQRMLDEGSPTEVLAFHDDIEHSKGTADMVARAKKVGLQVTLFSHKLPSGVVL